jgi:hypothetical protein
VGKSTAVDGMGGSFQFEVFRKRQKGVSGTQEIRKVGGRMILIRIATAKT